MGPAVAVFVRQGSLEIVESAELRPRTYVRNDFALVIPGHSPVTFVCGEATELLWFAFEPETTFTPEMLDSTVLHLADDSPVLKGVRAALLEIIYSPETSHPHMATSMRSFSRAIGRAITNEAFVPKSGDLLEAARAVVAQRATEIGFDTQRLARALGVSRRTLERAGAASQWNPSREIRNIRAQHAYSTINQHPHLSLRDVAASSGFGSIDSMRRTIRTIYGVSPAEARGVDPTSEDSGTTT